MPFVSFRTDLIPANGPASETRRVVGLDQFTPRDADRRSDGPGLASPHQHAPSVGQGGTVVWGNSIRVEQGTTHQLLE